MYKESAKQHTIAIHIQIATESTQKFSLLSRYKHQMKHMSKFRFKLFLLEPFHLFNLKQLNFN
jgi:hypothetical protein